MHAVTRETWTALTVDVVVCTRNNRDIVGPTLDAVAAQTVPAAACYVIDDRSSDGTVELIRERYPWVTVVVKDSAPGPASSRNIGVKRSSSALVAFFDSDARPAPDWIERQIAFLSENSAAGVVCGKLLDASRPGLLDCAYGTMNRYVIAWNQGTGERAELYENPARCMFACSAAVMCRRHVLEDIGGFDEALFAYYEDTDLGWRANLFGHEVWYNPAATAVHAIHGTMNKRTMGDGVIYLLWRNRLRSALVNYELSNIARYLTVYAGFSLLHMLLWAPRRPKLRAIIWNVAHLGDTLRRRHIVQTARRVSDRELWCLFRSGLRGPARLTDS